jgi:hypothetical protein
MAGDVSKVQNPNDPYSSMRLASGISARESGSPNVSQKAFDDYHLYTLQRPTTLLDRETKQVEMIRATGIKSKRVYIYDGVKIDNRYNGYSYENIRSQSDYGTQSNPKVWIMREFVNSAANGLGVPLPKGRMRFYRRDASTRNGDTPIEFTGENVIDHTPQGETVRVYTGDAFRHCRRAQAHVIQARSRRKTNGLMKRSASPCATAKKKRRKCASSSIFIAGRTGKSERLPTPFVKTDAQTVEFRVQLKPNEDKTITYTVHYSW